LFSSTPTFFLRPSHPSAPSVLTRIASPAGVAAAAKGEGKTEEMRKGVVSGPTACKGKTVGKEVSMDRREAGINGKMEE
jgi:hypothetical protein